MKIQQFIKKAIEGGWRHMGNKPEWGDDLGQPMWITFDVDMDFIPLKIEMFILDPKAWEAVGKVEGWDNAISIYARDDVMEVYQRNMLRMTQALIDGKSIEEFIETL